MGLEQCCYVCDAPDEPKSSRCKSCITSHKLLMKKIGKLDDLNPIKGLARELISHTRNKNNNISAELMTRKRLAFVNERFIPPKLISGPIL